MVTFCSIAGPSVLPQVRVLASGLRREHPDARVVVLWIGDPTPASEGEPFELLPVAELGDPELLAGTAGQSHVEALRPNVLQRALDDDADVAVFLDPEICVYGSLEQAIAMARECGVVLVHRVATLPDDGERPNHSDLLAAGTVSPAFVAVSHSADGERFLRWWSQRVAEPGEAEARWLDLVGDMFPSASTLEDAGYNVSYWNLHERPLERRGERLLAAGRPLRFIHYEGFRPDRVYSLSNAGSRVAVIEEPVLAEVCADYAERLRAAGWSAPLMSLVAAGRLGNGLPVDDFMQTLWAQGSAAGLEFGDPRSAPAAEAFSAWMREPVDRGRGAGVNRYLLAAYQRRTDLQQLFPDIDGVDGPRLIAWSREHGHRELGATEELLPPRPDGADETAYAHLGVNVMGFLRNTLGLAEAGRLYVEALTAAGLPVSTTAISADLPADPSKGKTIKRDDQAYQNRRAAVQPAFNLVCMNADQLLNLVRTAGVQILAGRPTIGHWAWETDVLPPEWFEAFRYVNEIWVNSTFVGENLGRNSPVPVVVVPQAIVVPDPRGVELELARDDRYTFLFMLDYFSTLRRKNALGLIEAFTRAFQPGEGPRLLLKTINAQFRRQEHDELRWKIGDRPDIDLVDSILDSRQKAALMARADCYVSLHRSEGFGLTLAESMALGTPVIATGYSGNMDFTTSQNSYLVDWTPTLVGPDCEIYPHDGRWAEPDLDHAAELMRRAWQRPDEARAKALRAQADIERLYAPGVVGRVARARLEFLSGGGSAVAAGRVEGGALATVERQFAFDLRRGADPAPGGLSGLIRRVVLRLIMPFTVHERVLDRALAEAVRELRVDLDRERAQVARMRARVHQLEEGTARNEDGGRATGASAEPHDEDASVAADVSTRSATIA